ncbi:meteorin-like protein [Cimex lectularius]|uniref:Meteorin-like protein n=1 Tax=Cimex lectularius TaxID=79782 RepID=A0A8I6TIA6_CIMLE|nr:meteorin-like protein [Cimex lectularius]
MTVATTSFLFSLFLALLLRRIGAHPVGQQCDWNGNGLSGGEKRGVRPVYLRCSEGKVGWSYPDGALRVLLRLGSSGRDFRACLRPAPGKKLPASIYLEGVRSLNKLYSPQQPTDRPHVRCVLSRGGQVALYVEAAEEPSLTKQTIEFAYDLQPLKKGSVYDPNEECRPCTKEEMTHAFCTNELVVRGMIQRVEPIEDTDVSEITVKVTKTLRRWSPWGENEVYDDGADKEVVQVGRHCGAQHGGGEMVIMARRKLGQLVLSCAPRLSEWKDVVREANIMDSAHCVLSS